MKWNLLKSFILSLFMIIMISCKKEKVITPQNPPPPDYSWYPLTIGNSWKYHAEIHIDSAGFPLIDEYFDVYWTAISDTLINGIQSTKILNLDSSTSGHNNLFYSYYANREDGFYGMALGGSGSSFHLRSNELLNNLSFSLTSLENNIQGGDTVYVPNLPSHIMKFPVVQYQFWHQHGFVFNSRQWLGDTIISTPAGTFNCRVLRVIEDYDGDGYLDYDGLETIQYFSTKGLIKETRYQLNFPGYIFNGTVELVSVNF